MKKVIFLSVAVFVFILSACAPSEGVTAKDIKRINKNADFELNFLEDVSQKDLSGFECKNDFHGVTYKVYYNPNKYQYTPSDVVLSGEPIVEYTVSPYPYLDNSDARFVTGILCSDPEITFFDGLSINSDAETCKQRFEKAGYSFSKSEFWDQLFLTAEKDDITICINKGVSFQITYDVKWRDIIIY